MEQFFERDGVVLRPGRGTQALPLGCSGSRGAREVLVTPQGCVVLRDVVDRVAGAHLHMAAAHGQRAVLRGGNGRWESGHLPPADQSPGNRPRERREKCQVSSYITSVEPVTTSSTHAHEVAGALQRLPGSASSLLPYCWRKASLDAPEPSPLSASRREMGIDPRGRGGNLLRGRHLADALRRNETTIE